MYIFSVVTANMLFWFLFLYIHTHKVNIITKIKGFCYIGANLWVVPAQLLFLIGAFNFIPYVPHILYAIIFAFIRFDLINKIVTIWDKLENIGYGE